MPDYRSVYTPPNNAPTAPIITPNQLYIREFGQGVTIPMTQNLFGGLGAFLVVATIGWRVGMTTEDFLILGGTIGLLLFGTATVIRAFRDEARQIIAAYGERQDKATRQALQAEVDQLRDEMKRLHSQGVVSLQYVSLMATERLLRDYFELHLDLTRNAAMKRGYTRAQWDAAMRLCRTAQVVSEKGTVLVATFAEAWGKVLHMQSAGMGSFAVTEAGDVVRKS